MNYFNLDFLEEAKAQCKTENQRQFLQKRADFIMEFCKEKNWSDRELTLDQIMEIRNEVRWRNPGGISWDS